MAAAKDPDITILEYGRLEDYLRGAVGRGDRVFRTVELADECDLSVPKVNEAMLHQSKKHEQVRDIGGGGWKIDVPE